MQWIIITKPKDGLNCEQEMTGPFETYDEAMDHFVTMGPASSYEHKYITELFTAEERARISGDGSVSGTDPLGRDHSRPASIDNVPAEWREAVMAELMEEAADMSSKELAFLLIEGMDQSELDERVRELKADTPESATVMH